MVINGFTNELSWKADEIPGGTCHELASHLRGRYNTSSDLMLRTLCHGNRVKLI